MEFDGYNINVFICLFVVWYGFIWIWLVFCVLKVLIVLVIKFLELFCFNWCIIGLIWYYDL